MSALHPLPSILIIACTLLVSWAHADSTPDDEFQIGSLENQQNMESFVADKLLLDATAKDDILSKPIPVELIPEPQIYAFATGLVVIGFVAFRKNYQQRVKSKAAKQLLSS